MPLPDCLMITQVWVSKNRLIGTHFAELTYNKMSDTEEVVEEEEAQYVHTSVIFCISMLLYVSMINVVIFGL